MNRSFCSVGKDLAKELPVTPNPLFSGEYTVNARGSTFCFSKILAHDIAHAMNKMTTTKSVGNDKISCYFFLKLAMPYISNSNP